MVIHKNHTLVNYTKCKGLKPEWIVMHYTGNRTDTAKANTDYFKSVKRGASASYFVGEDGIYMCVNPSKGYAWHCGKDYSGGRAKYQGIVTNRNSIGIEMCSQGGRIPDKTYKKTVKLVKKMMKKYSIPASHVIRHYDVCEKQCPGWEGWLPGNNVIWQGFKKDIKA